MVFGTHTSGADSSAGTVIRPRWSAAQLLAAKNTRPIRSLDDLAADTFESDEEPDEFLAFTYAERHRDLARPHVVHSAILDTDVASLLHRRKLTGPLATRLIGREPLISFVTDGELTKWAEIHNWSGRRRGELAGWIIWHPGAAWRRAGGRDLGAPVCGGYPPRPAAPGSTTCGLRPLSRL